MAANQKSAKNQLHFSHLLHGAGVGAAALQGVILSWPPSVDAGHGSSSSVRARAGQNQLHNAGKLIANKPDIHDGKRCTERSIRFVRNQLAGII